MLADIVGVVGTYVPSFLLLRLLCALIKLYEKIAIANLAFNQSSDFANKKALRVK
jgi:hypothetical protein